MHYTELNSLEIDKRVLFERLSCCPEQIQQNFSIINLGLSLGLSLSLALLKGPSLA